MQRLPADCWAKPYTEPGADVSPDTRRVVRVVSTKYDGTLHDTYEAELLDHVGLTVRLIVPAGTPIYGRKVDRVAQAEDDGYRDGLPQ
jgi:hypothetical protein